MPDSSGRADETTATDAVRRNFADRLGWASHGKSMPEIGEIIGMQARTVRFHLDNARGKLGAANLPHAVRLGLASRSEPPELE